MKKYLAFIIALVGLCSCDWTIDATDNNFECEVDFTSEIFKSGEKLGMTICANRERVSVRSLYCTPMEFHNLAAGREINTNNGTLTFETTDPVSVDYPQPFNVRIEIEDIEKTGAIRRFDITCTLAPADPEEVSLPERIVVGANDLCKSIDRNARTGSYAINVEPLGCTPDIYVRCINPDEIPGIIACATTDELEKLTEEDLGTKMLAYTYVVESGKEYKPTFYYRSGNRPGHAVFRIASLYNPFVYQDVEIYVKEDVVLIISTTGIHEGFYQTKGGYLGRAYGYAGYLQNNLQVRMCKFEYTYISQETTYTSTTEIKDKDQLRKDFSRLNALPPDVRSGDIEATFYIDCTPEQRTSKFMKGKWHWWGYESSPNSAASRQIKYDSNEWNSHKVTGPSPLSENGKYEETVSWPATQILGVELPGITEQINQCDDVLAIDMNYGGSNNWHSTEWEWFDIWHRDIKYDKLSYNLRYIIYSYKAEKEGDFIGGGKPWFWNSFEYEGKTTKNLGKADWCVEWKD